MNSKIAILRILLIIFNFLFICGLKQPFCQPSSKPLDKNETSAVAFEQALKNYDIQKQKEQAEFAGKLSLCLAQATENWINAAKKDKESRLNTRLEQEWEKLALFYPIPPVHFDYDLKGYKYSVIKSDIIKTDSLTSPYKGMVIIKEEIYAEKYHSPNISDIDLYFYTVTTQYILNLEYKNEKFNLVSSEKKIVSLENECPNEIKKMRL